MGSWNQSGNRKFFLQTAFLHEIGHAIFNATFERTAYSQSEILRTACSPAGVALSSRLEPARKGEEKSRDILMRKLGARFLEGFSDVIAVLAGKSLNIPDEAREELFRMRAREGSLAPYDTSKVVRAAINLVDAGNADISSLSKCVSIAKNIVMEGFGQDIRALGIESQEWKALREVLSLQRGSSAFILPKIARRRASQNGISPEQPLQGL